MQKETATTNTPSTTITKMIGGSVYKVQIHFSKTSKESFSDKLIRLIKNEIAKNSKTP